MTADGLDLRRASDNAPVDADAIGLGGVLSQRGLRGRAARVPGSLVVHGFRWNFRDGHTQRWWPQGIAVGEHDGIPIAIASWFEKPRRDGRAGSRITIVDLRDTKRPRYHHVRLVLQRRDATGIHFDPVPVHAGGIVWAGDRLLVAATLGGIHEFRLSGILAGNLLPEVTRYRPVGHPEERLRYSFLSLAGQNTAGQAGGELHLVAGEYGDGTTHRLANVSLTAAGAAIRDSHVPTIPQMQGAVLDGDSWFVTASRGDRIGGDLWSGTSGHLTRREGALPPGPEDLTLGMTPGELWSLSEFPGKRWVFAFRPDKA